MILWTFEDLLIIDVTLYGAALFLEFVALIVLRIKAPREHRPFKIPLNVFGLCIMALLPLGVYSIAIAAAFISEGKTFTPLVFAIVTLLSAELIWQIIRWRAKRTMIT
jgi:amino acid transporter